METSGVLPPGRELIQQSNRISRAADQKLLFFNHYNSQKSSFSQGKRLAKAHLSLSRCGQLAAEVLEVFQESSGEGL
jgi:hypothetical protein